MARHYCSDCAIDLKNAAGGEGKIVIFSGKDANWPQKYDWGIGVSPEQFRVPTAQGPVNFSYHSVYTDGKYFFDPLLSSNPIPQSEYKFMLNAANPNGTTWRIYEPNVLNPNIPQLQKGGY